MLIGYARVSTHEQTLNLQKDALEKAECSKIFTDVISGVKAERKGLDEALAYVRKGDTLVVWRLDRLGRSLPHLITTMTGLEERGIGFKSLTENIDTTTSGGKLIFHIFGALAEFERNLIRERTQAGLSAARARGKRAGRPKPSPQDNSVLPVTSTRSGIPLRKFAEPSKSPKPHCTGRSQLRRVTSNPQGVNGRSARVTMQHADGASSLHHYSSKLGQVYHISFPDFGPQVILAHPGLAHILRNHS
jgi:DNA invertase Pin-like site-specific DNA recombinase